MSTATSQIGDYQVVRELTPHESWLAVAPGERRVVIKKLGEDCLVRARRADDGSPRASLNGSPRAASDRSPVSRPQLRPNIRDRLGRVRELAHIGVANLHGVERDGALVYLVWEYIEGVPFATAAEEVRSAKELTQLARKLVLAVESLHALGIVHGALHERNVIVDPVGGIGLTHISPLLYNDPAEDVRAVAGMLQQVLIRREEEDSPLGRLVAEAAGGEMSLRQLSVRLASLRSPQAAAAAAEERGRDSPGGIRRRGLIGALIAALVGLVIALGLWQVGREPQSAPEVPLEADPAAMQAE